MRFSGYAVLGLVLAAVPATIVEMKFSATAFRLRNWRSPESRRMNYLEYVLANDDHAKEVKLFGLGPMLLDRFKELGETFYAEDRRLAIQRAGWAWGLSLAGHRRLLRVVRVHGHRGRRSERSRSGTWSST